MSGTHLSKLEQDLLRVPGVRSARVIGGDVPTEIHVVTTSKRSPKQVVRDVQSLAAAGFGIPIDHRIVSVVQLDDPPPAAPQESTGNGEGAAPAEAPQAEAPQAEAPPISPQPQVTESLQTEQADPETIRLTEATLGEPHELVHANGHRLVLERVVLASKGDAGWVKVALRWPNGETTEGAGVAGSAREARARGASVALLQALAPELEKQDAKIDVDHLFIHRLGSNDSVLVRAVFYERGSVTPLVGSALVYDDVATAAVRAILQAINRKLRLS